MLIIERAKEKGLDPIIPFYAWLLIMGTAAYSFSVVHAYSYSLIGYQGAFLKYYYPLYWHTACLTINAQAADIEDKENYYKALEEENEDYIKSIEEESKKKNKTSDYAKLAKAIFDIQQENVTIACPDINKSEVGYSVDANNNAILYGLKALDGIGDEVAKQIIELRPYSSFDDFLLKNVSFDVEKYPTRKKLDKNALMSLIFSNSFNCLGETNSNLIIKYMSLLTKTLDKLDTRCLDELLKIGSLPLEYESFIKMKAYMPKIKKFQDETNKKIWKIPKYGSPEYSIIIQHIYDTYYSCIEADEEEYLFLTKKTANQIYKEKETAVKDWLDENQESLKYKLNLVRIKQEFAKWTKGRTVSDLAFKAMGFYPGKSWLDTAAQKYGISEYLDLPRAENNIISYGTYKGEKYPIFKISQIPITVIEKDAKHKCVTGLTKGAVVTLKFKTEVYDYYSNYFERGEKLIVWGYRGNKDDTFTVKLYSSARKNCPDTHTVIKV